MRIIAGKFRGRRLRAPAGRKVRPTADRVKESLFNVLGSVVEDAVVLDLFAGTGNLGLEAVSRGAARAVLVEDDPRCLAVIQENIRRLGVEGLVEVRPEKVGHFLQRMVRRGETVGMTFADPPYGRGEVGMIWRFFSAHPHLTRILVVEHSRREGPPSPALSPALVRQLRFGETLVSVFDLREVG